MIIESKKIEGKNLIWMLRCPTKQDAAELSQLRIEIDGETEYLDREAGEGFLSQEDFERLIYEDSIEKNSVFLLAEADGKIVGFARCKGNKLSRFKHKAEFGICILKKYWGYGIGKALLENILIWADTHGVRKIALNVVETNSNAIKLYESFGFVEEGLLINDRIHRDGSYYNTVIMGRFK